MATSRLRAVGLAAALTFSFPAKPTLAEPPQAAVGRQTVLEATPGMEKRYTVAPKELPVFLESVFVYVQNGGSGEFKTTPMDPTKGAMTPSEYEKSKVGDCSDNDLYTVTLLVNAQRKGLIPADAIIGTVVYKPNASPEGIWHLLTYVAHPSLKQQNDPLSQAIAHRVGQPIVLLDPAADRLGQIRYPGTKSYVVVQEEREGLYFQEQADIAFRRGEFEIARKLYEKAYDSLKNNKEASQEVREKLATYEFNDGMDALMKDDYPSARAAIQKAQGYNPKPLYEAYLRYIGGLEVYYKQNDVSGAKEQLQQAKKILEGTQDKQARDLITAIDGFLIQLPQ